MSSFKSKVNDFQSFCQSQSNERCLGFANVYGLFCTSMEKLLMFEFLFP